MYETFEEMTFSDSLITGINLWGISLPTRIQKIGIPAFLRGHDMIIEVPNSEQGKTTLAAIATLSRIKSNVKQPQAIFLLKTSDKAELVETKLN